MNETFRKEHKNASLMAGVIKFLRVVLFFFKYFQKYTYFNFANYIQKLIYKLNMNILIETMAEHLMFSQAKKKWLLLLKGLKKKRIFKK